MRRTDFVKKNKAGGANKVPAKGAPFTMEDENVEVDFETTYEELTGSIIRFYVVESLEEEGEEGEEEKKDEKE